MLIPITTAEFDLLRKFIQSISGICLDDTKTVLMESRLSPLLEQFECSNYMDLYHKAQHNDEVRLGISNAISTNETSFFRDHRVFEMIQDDFIPHFLNKSNSLHIWSAASSFGQEPYSLSMILNEAIPNIDKYDIKIEATDISNEAIAHASYGLYSKLEVGRGIDASRLAQHFSEQNNGYRIKDHIRYLVHYRELNLLQPLPFRAQFDIILCRNVAIYFDNPTKQHLFAELAKCLKPNGRLILGSTESLWNVTDIFTRQEYKNMIYYTVAEQKQAIGA